jgi:heterodisulfide reductase subunit B
MNYAFFQGCNIPIRIQQYASSAIAVFKEFGVTLEVIEEFNCCGYPARNVDEKAYLLPSIRNLAIAEQKNLDILVICNCCFASLQKAKNVMAKNPGLMAEMNAVLAGENLHYSGTVAIRHYLAVLHDEIGVDRIKSRLSAVFNGLNISVIHGCHVLRPREITTFDDSFVPRITEDLVAVTGATSVDWRGRLECCGAALAGINNELSEKLLREKISGALAAGADFVTPICSYCHLQFDTAQLNMQADAEAALPVLLYPQLLGLCLGINEKVLGIEQNRTISAAHISKIRSLAGPPVEDKKKKKKAKAAA